MTLGRPPAGSSAAITIVAAVAPLLLILLAVSDADREPARVMLETATQTFGGDMRIAVEPFEGSPPALAALVSAAQAREAAVVARVLWRQGGAQATLDVYVARSGVFTHRALTFHPRDRAAERGRTIGLVLAALSLPSEDSRLGPAEASPTAAVIAASPTRVSVSAPANPPLAESTVVAPTAGAPAAGGFATENKITPRAPGPWALEALVAAGVAVAGSGGGLGGGVAVRRFLGDRWGARLGLQARTGSVPSAQSSSLAAGLAAGLFGRLRPAGVAVPRWNFGARLDVLLGYEMLTHFSDDDPEPVRRGRFLPVADAWLETDWAMTPTAMLHAGIGIEAAAGSTLVVVRGLEVARISPFRAVAQLGFLLRF